MSFQVDKLKYYVRNIVPTVYDDTLSHYELQNRVVEKLNEVVENVNSYFDEDIDEHVGAILSEWYDNGKLETIINDSVMQDINTRVTDLDSKIDNTEATLSSQIETESTAKWEVFSKVLLNPTLSPYNLDPGTADNTQILQQIIDDGYTTIYLPSGTIRLDSVSVQTTGVTLIGQGQGKTILKKVDRGTDNALLNFEEVKGVSISNLTVAHQNNTNDTCNLLRFNGVNDVCSNIHINKVSFIDTDNGKTDMLKFNGFISNLHISECYFEGVSNTSTEYSSACIKFDNLGEFLDIKESPAWINNNQFVDCKEGVTFIGAGSPMSPLFIDGNHFLGQTRKALQIYHGERYYITNNKFEDVYADFGFNNDGGVLWLDQVNHDDDERCIVRGNVLHECTGNGIFLEEFKGIIQDNEIRRMHERTEPYETIYTYGDTSSNVSSLGGNGILLTGGCKETIIKGNSISECGKSAVMFNRAFGVHQGVDLENIYVQDNYFKINRHTIMLVERVITVFIKNNMILSDFNNSSAYGIQVSRTNTHSSNTVRDVLIEYNTFRGFNAVQNQTNLGRISIYRNNMYLFGSATSGTVRTLNNYKFDITNLDFVAEL